MLLIESFLIFAMITTFMFIAAFAIRDAWDIPQGRFFAALAICLASLSLTAIPDFFELPDILYYSGKIIGIPNLGLVWWFILSLLKDDFRLGLFEYLGMLILCLAPGLYLLDSLGIAIPFWHEVNVFGGFIPFVMILHVIWITLVERKNDLVEQRRKARILLAIGLMLATLVSLLSEYLSDPAVMGVVRNGFGLPIAIIGLFWLTRLQPETLHFKDKVTHSTNTTSISPKDLELQQKLLEAMETKHLFKEPGLTISMLAQQLDSKEHRLRALINKGMHYRNFSSFLSGYRIGNSKEMLSDPKNSRLPILTIAMESGFSSLQTFNRVFKEVEQITPTAYRSMQLKNRLDSPNHEKDTSILKSG